MTEWLRPLLKLFYAPAQGMDEVRERASLGRAVTLALCAHLAYTVFTEWLFLRSSFTLARPAAVVSLLFEAGSSLLVLAFVFAPTVALVSNLFERRGRLSLVLQQEYTALASTLFYAWAAASLLGLPLALAANLSGVQAAYIASSMESAARAQEWFNLTPEMKAQLADPFYHAENLFGWIRRILFAVWAVYAMRAVFRLSVWRALSVLFASSIILLVIAPIWGLLYGRVFASPFLLLLLFILLRGYFGELARAQRARAAFRQNLEAATLNPADASAHYNLGLIHQQRNELEEARKRFERAIEIDPDETDSHYQLGRIARTLGRLSDAIKHFEQVVTRNPAHAQHEVWREIGATYLAAGQFADAREALERFLEDRPNDPEGLYLMGRAHAGLGHPREAATSMQACIEAVKTAPAYKYRTEKRWLNEAQQFLKTVTSDKRTATNEK